MIDPASDEVDVLTRLEAFQRNALVERAAAAVLDPVEQEIVQLRYVYDYPLADIPPRLPNTASGSRPRDANGVRVALQRIRRRLRAEIGRMLATDGVTRDRGSER